ncbi:MAG: nitroreductase family protein [Candidatus Woesearchaeota archaeon]|nr:nitroreductase family protein [Candidatus Woesearchaeota archaeon]
MSSAIEIIKGRRSVRRYEKKAIKRKVLSDIIDAARLAPSSMNSQPWEFIVITGKKTLLEIARESVYNTFIKDAAAAVIVSGIRKKPFFRENCGAATENILLAAKAHGIGSCWTVGRNALSLLRIKKALGIPSGQDIIAIVSLGYSREKCPSSNKKPLEKVIHWEKY